MQIAHSFTRHKQQHIPTRVGGHGWLVLGTVWHYAWAFCHQGIMHQFLLPNQDWACRLLDMAARLCGKLSPRQQAVIEGALNLALRLGLPADALLDQLLHTEGGASLYEAYRRAVRCSSDAHLNTDV